MIKTFQEDNYICFTCDLDWAPEVAIEETMELFDKNEIRPTVFVTHPSIVIDNYKDKIDLGIHPNFILPSSQGSNIEEIIDYCVKLAPKAKVFRAHRWFSSNDIYDHFLKLGFTYESNLCTNMDIVPPFIHRSGIICFPVFLEDGAYIINSGKLEFDLVKHKFMQKGLMVINIHPMHYALNTPYFKYTRKIKDELTRQEWNMMDKDTLFALKYEGQGIADFIRDLICFVKMQNMKVITLDQAYQLCRQELNLERKNDVFAYENITLKQ